MLEPKDITILIVDDELDLRKAIVFDFKRRGFNVLDAGCGRDALEIIRKNSVNVVLSDVRMPNGDGLELLDNIKNLNPRLPVVIFITGFTDISLEEAYHRGADAIFSKPFDRKDIMESVLNAVKSKETLWSVRKLDPRVETNFDIELTFPELNLIASGKVLNMGRGGLFIALNDSFPEISAKMGFQINFTSGTPKSVNGQGIVRWIRTDASKSQLTGCGVEFVYLSDDCREQIISFIDSLKSKAFIPKG